MPASSFSVASQFARAARHSATRTLLTTLALAGSVAAFSFAGCANQAEGERCNTNAEGNGNSDCLDTLVCKPAGTLFDPELKGQQGIPGFGVCCPVDPANATTSACGAVAAPAATQTEVDASDLADAPLAPPATPSKDGAAE